MSTERAALCSESRSLKVNGQGDRTSQSTKNRHLTRFPRRMEKDDFSAHSHRGGNE